MDSGGSDEAFQDRILPHVSRTFALTIPQLPAALRTPVTNAYLLCRIADTIEDEPALSPAATLVLLQRFVAVVCGREDAAPLAKELAPQFSDQTLPAERELARNLDRVVRVTASLDEQQRIAIQRCLEIMSGGMHQFQRIASLRGLPRLSDLDDYCYYVAGVVGQMLTELFCGYSAAIAQQRSALHELAVSFAQGLQMTNILKDIWEDRARGACWLPQEVFTRHGIDLAQLSAVRGDQRFDAGMSELVAVAHAHLRDALAFTFLIPGREAGIRRFCLWAIGLAVLTLGKIHRTPGFTAGTQVKVSHSAVAMTRLLTTVAVGNDWMLTRLFERAASGVPLAAAAATRRAPPPTLHSVAAVGEFGHGARHLPLEGVGRRSEGRSAH
ncbi:MAG TPA: phytoene/squalene synthase family protein [Steroidobacteraceae bacterium]